MGEQGNDAQRIAPMIETELTALRQRERRDGDDLPRSQAEVETLLQLTRERGMARVVNSLLSGVAGFCAPVFDAQGRLALGLVALGSVGTFDTDWSGRPAQAVLGCARQLSADLGHSR
jgi:DNA-binding IclR family transcriptional regulator